jgi:xanthine dehydrogenase accessory factor
VTPLALEALVRALGPAQPGGPAALLVTVQRVQGSAPRDEGAWMAVFPDRLINTLGGGHLEHSAIQLARQWLREGLDAQGVPDAPDTSKADEVPNAPGSTAEAGSFTRTIALGPSLGQCCGGVVDLRFERLKGPLSAELRQRLKPRGTPVAVFGGGHVGTALVRVLATLPFEVRWVDSRDEIFPPDMPPQVQCEHSDPVQAAVADLAPGSRVLIMSFSHAEDLDIVQACLKRQRQRADLPFIGLIGSKTKWATFRHRLRERGFSEPECDQITCPIGVPGIEGKEPEVIAVAVAAQLLQGLASAASA